MITLTDVLPGWVSTNQIWNHFSQNFHDEALIAFSRKLG